MQSDVNTFTAEQNLLFAAAGAMTKYILIVNNCRLFAYLSCRTFTNYLTDPFIWLFTSYKVPSYFSSAMTATVSFVNSFSAIIFVLYSLDRGIKFNLQ